MESVDCVLDWVAVDVEDNWSDVDQAPEDSRDVFDENGGRGRYRSRSNKGDPVWIVIYICLSTRSFLCSSTQYIKPLGPNTFIQ